MSGSIRTSISTKRLYDILHVLLKSHRWCECVTVQDEILAEVVRLQGQIRHAEAVHHKNQERTKNDRKTSQGHR